MNIHGGQIVKNQKVKHSLKFEFPDIRAMFKLFLLILIVTVFEIPFEIDDPIFFRVMMI